MNAADDLHEVETIDPSELTFTRRAWVDATPADVYGLVSEVSLISRWSPNASDVAFDEGAGPEAGAWFSGRNRRNGAEWITRSQVVKAAPGVAFVFVVGGAENGIVEWTWTFQAGMPVAPWRPPPWSGPPRLPKVTVPSVRTRRRVVCRALIRHFSSWCGVVAAWSASGRIRDPRAHTRTGTQKTGTTGKPVKRDCSADVSRPRPRQSASRT